MNKIKAMVSMLVVVFAFGTVAASSASAAEFLLNGVPIGGPTEKALVGAKDVGGVELTDMKGGVFGEEVTIKCNGTGHGFVWNEGGKGKGETTEAVETECVTTKGTCASKPTLTAIHLPWFGEVTSTTSGVALVSSGKEPGYEVVCSLGVKDTCVLESSASLTIKNLTAAESGEPFAGIDGEATQAEAEANPGGCTRGGAKQGLKVGKAFAFDPNGDLSVS